jgi:hypothetical protein
MKNKKRKKILKNKSWDRWSTRKFSFINCLLLSNLLIIFGGFLALETGRIDTAVWLESSFRQLRFIIGTGTLIVLLPFDEFKEFILAKFGLNLEED